MVQERPDFVVVDLARPSLKFSTAGRMAATIEAIRAKNGGCMPQDLNAKGFMPQEVVDHWDAAHFLIAINNLGSWGKDNAEK
jgi:hypothetical protein